METGQYISSIRLAESPAALENVAQKVVSAKIRLLYSQLLIGLAGSFTCATIIFWSIPSSSIPLIKEWYVGMIIITLFRILLFMRYVNHCKKSPVCTKPYIYIFFITALMTGVNWGLLGSVMMPPSDHISQMIIVIIIAGVSAGAAQSLQSNLILSIIYLTIVVLPLATWTFMHNEPGYFFLGISLITYLFFSLTSTWRGNKILTKSLQFHFENIILTETLEKEATHDAATELFNRRYLNVTLPRELKRIVREKTALCFAMIDVDHFKSINDTYGHDAGDEVLKKISQILKKHFRESDMVCRFGGDEFVIVSLNIYINDMVHKLEAIQKELRNKSLKIQNAVIPSITLSIGVSEAPRQAVNMKELLTITDKALYAAKKSGRDRIVVEN